MPDGSTFGDLGKSTSNAGHALAAGLRRAPWRRIALWTGGVFGALLAALILLLALADWNALRGPIGRMASGMAGRPIVLAGDLDVHPWSLTPRIEIRDLRIGNPYWGGAAGADWGGPEEHLARIPRVAARIELLPLLTGDVVFRDLQLSDPDIHLRRDKNGRANWSGDPKAAREKPLRLPLTKRFVVTNGQIIFADVKRRVTLKALVNSGETLGADPRGAFRLAGEGALNNQPFSLTLTGAGLLNANRARPYAFDVDLRAGPTSIKARGSIARPFDLTRYQADVDARGADLGDLYAIIGLALPNTPPYALKTHLSRTSKGYTLANISGRVGDSDLSGRMDIRTDRPRKFIEANITSRSLDFDDLAAVLGAPPSVKKGEAASPEQRAEAARLKAQGRVLPDARLDLERVRAMDAHLLFKAGRVVDSPFPLRSASADMTLRNGVMTFTPIVFDLPRGNVSAQVKLDATGPVPVVDMDARIARARIEDFFKTKNVIEGAFMARAKLRGRGATVRAAAADASGAVTFVMPRGGVRAAFAELTGINIARGLGLLLTGDKSQTELRCGVASFKMQSGVARPDLMVFDTENMLIRGEGAVDLRDETLDLQIQGDAKEPRLVKVDAPIRLSGHWRAPKVGVKADDALKQGALGGLASLLNPLAALLPFVDAGLAEDADCKALLARKSVTQATK